MDNIIGLKIKGLRGERTQEEFAKELGISLRAFKYYESGEREPPISVVRRIAEVCGIPVEELLNEPASAAGRVAEEQAPYLVNRDEVVAEIVRLLDEIGDEGYADVLAYTRKITPYFKSLPAKQLPPSRPIPIDFDRLERYALRIYELAERKGLAREIDQIFERLLSEKRRHSKKETGGHV